MRGRPIHPAVRDKARSELETLMGRPASRASCAERLTQLAQLEPGWLYGEGVPIPASEITWLIALFARLEILGMPQPHLFPTPEGHVQAEWSLPHGDIEACFRDGAAECTFTRWAGHDDIDAFETSIALDSDEGLAALVNLVQRFA
jgi:hypothetical protein